MAAMKPLVLTFHAPGRIAERKIASEWVERTAREPEWTEPDPKDAEVERRSRTIPEFGGRRLRVAVVETPTSIRVISVHFDRRATRRHARHDVRSRS